MKNEVLYNVQTPRHRTALPAYRATLKLVIVQYSNLYTTSCHDFSSDNLPETHPKSCHNPCSRAMISPNFNINFETHFNNNNNNFNRINNCYYYFYLKNSVSNNQLIRGDQSHHPLVRASI